MVDEALERDSAIVCHDTLDTAANAICRGFFDRHATIPLRLAKITGRIRYDPPRS